MYSFKDAKINLWVACVECKRGINGEKSCACGWYQENPIMGCFCGELLPEFDTEETYCCEECGAEPAYETETGWLCAKCDDEYRESLQAKRENDPAYYCISCGKYSDILDHGKCPMCFEMDGYT